MKYVGWVFLVFGVFLIAVLNYGIVYEITIGGDKWPMEMIVFYLTQILLAGVGAYIIKNFTPNKDESS